MAAKIIAHQGDRVFLLQNSETRGQVLDLDRRLIFPEQDIYSILGRGYWDEYMGPQTILDSLLSQVEPR